MKKLPKKEALRDELVGFLEGELAGLEESHASTIEGVTHPDAKQESDKDTRAIEQQYLARGQADRIESLKMAIAEVKVMPVLPLLGDRPVTLGALVDTIEDDAEKVIFLAPQGGGTTLAKGKIMVVTPSAPLGRSLLGKKKGDVVELVAGKRVRAIEIAGIH